MIEKNYKIELKTLGPVHIGSGEIIKKNEYLYDQRRKRIAILKQDKLMELIARENLVDKYISFMTGGGWKDLFKFIQDNNLSTSYKSCIRYELNIEELVFDGKTRINDVNTCIKDMYNKPYIPGSSLKGAIINNLLFHTAKNNRKTLGEKYYYEIKKYSKDDPRTFKKNISKIEKEIIKDLSGIIGLEPKTLGTLISVSDSTPSEVSEIVLAQKYDYFPEEYKKGNAINLLRESIKTNTKFDFSLKLQNTRLLDIYKLESAIEDTFLEIDDLIRVRASYDELDGINIYLGGGTGFISKTIIYGLFEGDKRLEISEIILKKLFPKIDRSDDRRLNLVPKTIKEGITPEDYEEMGICNIKFVEV